MATMVHSDSKAERISKAREHYRTRSQRRPKSPCRVCGGPVHGRCGTAKKAA